MTTKNHPYPLAHLGGLEAISYIRKNQGSVVSWFGFRIFDISRQVEIALRLKRLRQARRNGEITLAELGIGRLEWHCRILWAKKHQLLRWFYIRAQIFTLRHFPHLHKTHK